METLRALPFYSFKAFFHSERERCLMFKVTVNPLLRPRGRGLLSSPFEGGGGLIREGDLFNLETTMVSVLHKELEYRVEKPKYKKVEIKVMHTAEDQNQIRTSTW